MKNQLFYVPEKNENICQAIELVVERTRTDIASVKGNICWAGQEIRANNSLSRVSEPFSFKDNLQSGDRFKGNHQTSATSEGEIQCHTGSVVYSNLGSLDMTHRRSRNIKHKQGTLKVSHVRYAHV